MSSQAEVCVVAEPVLWSRAALLFGGKSKVEKNAMCFFELLAPGVTTRCQTSPSY